MTTLSECSGSQIFHFLKYLTVLRSLNSVSTSTILKIYFLHGNDHLWSFYIGDSFKRHFSVLNIMYHDYNLPKLYH